MLHRFVFNIKYDQICLCSGILHNQLQNLLEQSVQGHNIHKYEKHLLYRPHSVVNLVWKICSCFSPSQCLEHVSNMKVL